MLSANKKKRFIYDSQSESYVKSYASEEFLVWFQHKIDTPREDINQYWTITNEEILQYIMKNFFSVESLKPLYIDLIRKPDIFESRCVLFS